jgi:hypothetical protein
LPDLGNIISRTRAYLRDYPQNNIILSYTQESSDSDIADALQRAVDTFNMTPPYNVNYTVATFPNDSLLVMGTVIEVLKSAEIKYARNRLPFSDAGVSIEFDDQTSLYNSIIQSLEGEYIRIRNDYKMSTNLESAYGVLSRWEYYG